MRAFFSGLPGSFVSELVIDPGKVVGIIVSGKLGGFRNGKIRFFPPEFFGMQKAFFDQQFFERGLIVVMEKMGQTGLAHIEKTGGLLQSGFPRQMGVDERKKPLIAEVS